LANPIKLVFFAPFNSEVAIEGITQGHDKMEHISVKPRELIMAETCERIIHRYSFLVGTCTFVYNLFVHSVLPVALMHISVFCPSFYVTLWTIRHKQILESVYVEWKEGTSGFDLPN